MRFALVRRSAANDHRTSSFTALRVAAFFFAMTRVRCNARAMRRRSIPYTAAVPVKAAFISPMLLLRADVLPDEPRWEYQLKLDGYRAVAFKAGGRLHLRSRNDKDFSTRYPAVIDGLAKLPDETVVDGEIVTFDEDGRPSFSALQNFGSSSAPVVRGLAIPDCPFTNLPEARSGRWGQGLTKAKMAECRWLMPKLVGHFRISGMDARRPPEARKVRRPPRRQQGA